MTTRRFVDRAGIQAGTAANAREDFGVIRLINLAPPVVYQDDIHMIRAIRFALAARAVDHVGVDGHELTRRAAWQHLSEHGVIFQGRDNLLNAY